MTDERFDRWKSILDRYDAGEITDAKASKMLDELRAEETRQFEELCQIKET